MNGFLSGGSGVRMAAVISAIAVVAMSALPAAAAPTWSVAQDTTTPPTTELTAVDCITAARCYAVGYRQIDDDYKSAIEQGNGTLWSKMASPDPAGERPNNSPPLKGVACASAHACFGVGTYYNTSDQPTALIKYWNGSAWGLMKAESPVIVKAPHVQRSRQTSLNSVSCPTAKSCYAVGYYQGSTGAIETLVEHWSGKTWAAQTAPTSVALATVLYGVSCATDTSCFAVGTAISASHTKPFIIRWDGAKWSTAASPGLANAGLSGISCASAKSCVAIGSIATTNTTTTLVERWNGTKWSVVTLGGMLAASGLFGVSCPTTTSCLAVGRRAWGQVSYRTLAVRWNGKTWSMVAPPNQPGARSNWLNSVSCSTPTLCRAVGTSVTDNQLHSLVVQLG